MGLWKKQEKVEDMLERYFVLCDKCYDSFEEAMRVFFESGMGEVFDVVARATHDTESMADDIRRDIELMLYGKALLPESRGDLLGLLEAYDGLPNIAETLVHVLHTQRTELPDELIPRYQQLVEINVRAYRAARKAVEALFSNPRATLHTTKEVDLIESESDRVERETIRAIFGMDITNGTKLLHKEVVLLLGEISDRAEKVADRIGIIAIKRQI